MNQNYKKFIHAARGFTLIELMIVVAVIAILASVVIPSYLNHVRKARRAGAEACLTTAAQQMERFYTTQLAYNAAGAPANFVCDSAVTPFYTVARSAVTATTFTVSATPIGAQSSDSCGTLRLTNTGVKTPATAGCW